MVAANGAMPDLSNPSIESNLDVQTTVSTTYPLNNQIVSQPLTTGEAITEALQVHSDLA